MDRDRYVRPKLLPSGHLIDLKEARHPCIELQDTISYQPNDVYMDNGTFKNYLRIFLIYIRKLKIFDNYWS